MTDAWGPAGGWPATADWHPVARSADVTDLPVPVLAGGREFVVFRPEPDGPAAVVSGLCPHRGIRLAHGTVVGGRLQCPYHGWEFSPSGRCALIPSSGPEAAVPPRAHLTAPLAVREDAGTIWIALPTDDAPPSAPPAPERISGSHDGAVLLTNTHPALEHCWHPLILRTEVPHDGSEVMARLLGRTWTARRDDAGRVAVEPRPFAVAERFGLIWVAPQPPRTALIDCPDDADPQFVGAWLPPERSSSPAGALAENFLDVAHFPFVHAGTFGAAEEREVPAYEVETGADWLRSVQEQWFDNREDPGVTAGLRPVRQRRRASYTCAVPFQLTLRLEELDAGAVKTILFFLQPEDDTSTRIYTKMLFHGIGGVARPGPDVVAAEVAYEQSVLAEDLHLQRAMTVRGLPLRLRDELHVRSDRSGIALRRILQRLVGSALPSASDEGIP